MVFGKNGSSIYGKLDAPGRRAFKEKNIKLDKAVDRSGRDVDKLIEDTMMGRKKLAMSKRPLLG